jgi:transcriptional regulator with XRE-family HTH domain
MTDLEVQQIIADIPVKIKRVRKARGYSQKYLAQRLNISQNIFSKVERGEIEMSMERLIIIAEVLDIEVLNLLS